MYTDSQVLDTSQVPYVYSLGAAQKPANLSKTTGVLLECFSQEDLEFTPSLIQGLLSTQSAPDIRNQTKPKPLPPTKPPKVKGLCRDEYLLVHQGGPKSPQYLRH